MLKLSLTTEPYEMNFGDEWIFLNFMAMIIEILFFYLKNSMFYISQCLAVVAILDIIIDIHKGNFVKGFSYHMIIYVLFEFNSVSRIQGC
jgi:hypothetical protein